MLDKKKIGTLVERFIGGTDKFLVDVVVSKGNVVDVYVDGDDGITINECVEISRHIESNFDRDREDYELRVSSPGIDKPFKLRRQYGKYMDREIRIELNDGARVTGKLLKLADDELLLECLVDKKKKNMEERSYAFSDIRQGKPVISFK
jgi:ribosome maturation factor RimP